ACIPIHENMAIAAKKYTTSGSFSVACDVLVLFGLESSSGEVEKLRGGGRNLAKCVGDGTYFNETNHNSEHTTAPPSAAPVQPNTRATAGKNSPANNCEA